MKNIGFINYDLSVISGVGKVTEALANEFCNYANVTIISICNENGKSSYKYDTRVKIIYLQQKELRLLYMVKKAAPKLKKVLIDNKIDEAIIMGHYAACIACATNFWTDSRYIFCDHGAILNQWKDKKSVIIRLINSLVSDKVVVLTKRSLNDYKKKFHIKDNKILYIYNWINDDYIKRDRTYNERSKIILTVGRFGYEKGMDLMVKVAKRILPQNPDWYWYVYGDGESFNEIESQIKKNGLENQLILKGVSNNIDKMYSDTAIYVLPSYREGLPMVLLEAMAYKIPAISFDVVTGPREIITNGTNGYLIKPYDIDDMANKLLQLMHNKEKRKEMSSHTYDKLNRFSKEKILKKWKELLDL